MSNEGSATNHSSSQVAQCKQMNKTCSWNTNLADAIWIRKYEYCKQLFDKQFKHLNNFFVTNII